MVLGFTWINSNQLFSNRKRMKNHACSQFLLLWFQNSHHFKKNNSKVMVIFSFEENPSNSVGLCLRYRRLKNKWISSTLWISIKNYNLESVIFKPFFKQIFKVLRHSLLHRGFYSPSSRLPYNKAWNGVLI